MLLKKKKTNKCYKTIYINNLLKILKGKKYFN